MKKNLILLIISVFAIFQFSCNEEPTAVGISLITDSVSVKSVSSDSIDLITQYKPYWQNSPTFNVGGILLGKTENTDAVSLIRFQDLPDSLDYLEPTDFNSVKLIMHPDNYTFGENTSNLSFDIKKVTKVWKRDSTFYDDLMVSPADYFDDAILSGYNGSIDNEQDTIPPLEIDLPAELMTEWFETEIRAVDTSDGEIIYDTSAIVNYGLALLPNEGSSYIQRFKALGQESENSSRVEAVFTNNESELDTVILRSAIESSYCDAPEPEESSIIIQGGITYRTEIGFDVSTLPDLAGIHKSELTLYLNEEKSIFGSEPKDSIIALRLYNNIEPLDSKKQPIIEWTGSRVGNSNKYVFSSVSSAVEKWNRSDKTGKLVLLTLPIKNELLQLDRLIFYGKDAPEELRPKLNIIYSYTE